MAAVLAHFHSLEMKTGCVREGRDANEAGLPRENCRTARGRGWGELEEGRERGREDGREGGRGVGVFSRCRCWLDLRRLGCLGRAS